MPVGFTAIRLTFDLETDAAANDVAALIELTERYCVVLQTLKAPTTLTTRTLCQAGASAARAAL